MRQILVIDDLRSFRVPPTDAQVTYARTSKAGIEALDAQPAWDEIWLDHDLGQDQFGVVDSIMPVIDVMSERSFDSEQEKVKVAQVYVHTSNPSGARQMLTSLARFRYPAKQVQAEQYFIV